VLVNRLWFTQTSDALNAFTLDTAQKETTNVIASFPTIQQLAEISTRSLRK